MALQGESATGYSLTRNLRTYVGLSSQVKPRNTATDEIPAGSVFLELDTGREYRWAILAWVLWRDEAKVAAETLDVLKQQNTLLEETRDLLKRWIYS